MAKKNIMNNTTKELVKVDMNSTWAKEVLLPALKNSRESGEAWTIIKAPLEFINEFEGQRGYKHSLSYILSNFDYKRVEVNPLISKMAVLPVGMVSTQLRDWKSWVTKPHGLDFLITSALKKKCDSSASNLRG